MKNNEKVGDFVMNPQNMITDKEQKAEDDISSLKSKIFELQKTLQAKEIEFEKEEKKKKGLKTYLIHWVKYFYEAGEEEIEASTEEEALQIARDNLGEYQGHFDACTDPMFEFECFGPMEE